MRKTLFLITAASALLLIAAPALALVYIDSAGTIQRDDGRVLSSSSGSGSGDPSSGSSGSGSGSGEESDTDSSGSSSGESGSGSTDDQPTETREADGTRTKTEVGDDGEVRTEIRLPDDTKVKTRTEEGRSRTDVYQGGVKVRLEREDGRFRLKAENEQGETTDLGDDEIISIDERADKERIRIRTFNTAPDGAQNRAIVERLNTQALTDLPLSVNLETNELTVTTPAGERTVTVLPDQAVQNMLAANVIDRIGGPAVAELLQQSSIETLEHVITLAEQNGVPVYEIAGTKQQRLFGFIPVAVQLIVTVSAETGEVLDTDQSFVDSVIDFFALPI